MTSLTQ